MWKLMISLIASFLSVDAFQQKLSFELSREIRSALDPIIIDPSFDQQSVKPLKIIQFCGRVLAECILNSQCRNTLRCIKKCPVDQVDCTNNCFFQYSNPIFNHLAECMIKNECLPLISFSKHSCPFGGNISSRKNGLIDQIFLNKDNIGRYYVARGWNRGYDCADCQKLEYVGVIRSHDVSDDYKRLDTYWSSQDNNGVVKTVNNTLVQDGPSTMTTKYKLFGMDVEEHYYLLDWTNDGSWVMFYYCGYGFGSEYQGGLLLTRNIDFEEIPSDIEIDFDTSIRDARLSDYLGPISEWCQPNFTQDCKGFWIKD